MIKKYAKRLKIQWWKGQRWCGAKGTRAQMKWEVWEKTVVKKVKRVCNSRTVSASAWVPAREWNIALRRPSAKRIQAHGKEEDDDRKTRRTHLVMSQRTNRNTKRENKNTEDYRFNTSGCTDHWRAKESGHKMGMKV